MTQSSEKQDRLVLERGDGKQPLSLNLAETQVAMSRIHEIRNVNTATFGELLTVFISANSELSNAISAVRQELVKVDHRMNLLRSRLLIEEVPVILEERKLKNTQDVCSSLIMLNPEFAGLSYSYEVLKTSLEILESKVKTLRDAQFAVRDIAQLSFGKAFKSATLDTSDVRGRFAGEF